MNTIRTQDNTTTINSEWLFCVIAIWIAVFYSVVIQYTFINIPNGMLILGLVVLATFSFSCIQRGFNIKSVFTNESLWMLSFMIYMLPIGMITAPSANKHLTQWITSMEYMFMMIVIASVIKDTGTDSFHLMLFIISMVLAAVFLRNPVLYVTGGRYSISKEVNPNGLGMSFTTGVWVILYYQQKKKTPILITLASVMLLLYCIFKTGSRKALIAAGLIILLWYVFGYIPEIMEKKNNWKVIILLLSVLLTVFLVKEFISMYSGSDIEARMGGLDDEVTGGKRSSLYQMGWALIKLNPIFGIGFQGYAYYFGGYSHATLVEIPVSSGALGSIIYFASYYVSIKKCIGLFRRFKKGEKQLTQASEIRMIIILWIAMLFYCSCIIHPYQFDSFIIFGIIFGQASYLEKQIQPQMTRINPDQGRKCKWIK